MAAHHRGRARRQPYTPAPLWEHRREWGILLGMRKTTRVVGKEGQVVIAKPIRDSLGLAPGWISIQRLVDDHVELLISDVALVETAYVLASTYGVPRETVVDHLIALLRKANITTFRLPKEHVLEALTLCRPSGRVSFADALIWAAARAADATIYPLDERFPSVKNAHRPTIVINLKLHFLGHQPRLGRLHVTSSENRSAASGIASWTSGSDSFFAASAA